MVVCVISTHQCGREYCKCQVIVFPIQTYYRCIVYVTKVNAKL